MNRAPIRASKRSRKSSTARSVKVSKANKTGGLLAGSVAFVSTSSTTRAPSSSPTSQRSVSRVSTSSSRKSSHVNSRRSITNSLDQSSGLDHIFVSNHQPTIRFKPSHEYNSTPTAASSPSFEQSMPSQHTLKSAEIEQPTVQPSSMMMSQSSSPLASSTNHVRSHSRPSAVSHVHPSRHHLSTSPFTTQSASYSSMSSRVKKTIISPSQKQRRRNQVSPAIETPRAYFRASNPTMERKRDYYEVLGVSKGADADTIKKAYFALAKKFHPDTSKEPDAQKRFAEISSAYEVLRDDEKRRQYDQFGHDAEQFEQAGYGPGPGFNPEDLIREMFFGGKMGGGMGGMGFDFAFDMGGHSGARASRPLQGNDIQTELTISFKEAVDGCTKYVNVRTLEKCGSCKGEGSKAGAKASTCTKCHGTGAQRIMKGMFHIETTCGDCNGTGKSIPTCDTCHGDTVVPENRRVAVNVPAGVDTGTNLRLVGNGDAGYKNGPRGHMWVSLKVIPDPRFRRDGTDIHVTVPISLPGAVLGCNVQVPTLNGSVTLKVPPGTQPTDNQIMRDKGIKVVNRPTYGHQYIHFKIDIPRVLTPRARELMEQFAEEMNLTENVNIKGPSGGGSGPRPSRNIYGAGTTASSSTTPPNEPVHPDKPFTPPPRPSSSSSSSTSKPSESDSESSRGRKRSIFGKLKNALGKEEEAEKTTKH